MATTQPPAESDARRPVAAGDRIAPHALAALLVSVAAMSLLPVAVTGANLAFPDIEAEFADTSRATLSWALSGYSIVLAAFTLLGGYLSGRFGGRPMFLTGLLILAVASAAAGLAPTAGLLIAGRCLQGVGGALIVPSSLTVALARWPAERRALALGVWTASFPIGSSAAPAVAALILDLASWRWVFFGLAILASVTLAVAWRLVDAPAPSGAVADEGRPDLIGIVVGTAAVGLLALGIVQGPSWGWGGARTLGVLGVSAVLFPLFIRRCRRHPRPLVDLRLFSVRTFSVASVANVGVSMAGMSVWLLWPLLLTGVWGYDRLNVGLAITPAPVVVSIVAILSGRWADRRGYRGLLVTGAVLLVLGNVWFVARLGAEPDYWGAMFPGLIVFGVAMGLTFAPLNGAALVDLSGADVNQGNAAFNTGRFLAGAMGIAAVVAALGPGGGADPVQPFNRAFTLLAVIAAAAGALLVVAWPRRAEANTTAVAAPSMEPGTLEA